MKQRQLTQSWLDQRVGKVPLSVVRNLEHALKETEVNYVFGCENYRAELYDQTICCISMVGMDMKK